MALKKNIKAMKFDKYDYFKIMTFCFMKDNMVQINGRQNGKNNAYNNLFISRKYKTLLQSNTNKRNKQKTLIEKQAKDRYKQFIEMKVQKVNKYI